MFENNSSDDEEDDDDGYLFQSQFPIHDLCDTRVNFGNGGDVGVAGENLERLRKALTFPKKKKKNGFFNHHFVKIEFVGHVVRL